MAGLKPHHRVAIGVSGGPDSMALCLLASSWKTNGDSSAASNASGLIDGLLAIIVDHGLRVESKEEAFLVSRRVLDMGISCEIARCEWLEGKPMKGHLQEEARDKRLVFGKLVCLVFLFLEILFFYLSSLMCSLYSLLRTMVSRLVRWSNFHKPMLWNSEINYLRFL